MINFYSLLSGIAIGAIFAFVKLPIPAPQSFAGILGIVGLFAGYAVVMRFR